MGKKVEKKSFNKLKLFNKFEEELIKKEKNNIRRKIFIFEELLSFANKIERFSQNDWKNEIKNDIRYARVINGIRKTS